MSHHSIFGFLGPDGAGKTATMKLLLGLTRPSSGRIRVFGQDLHQTPTVRAQIGYMPQSLRFYPHLTARQTLRFCARFYPQCRRSRLEKRIDEMLVLVGLENRADRRSAGFEAGSASGSDGRTRQITDGEGRTFYRTDLTDAPTQWSDILDRDQSGIPNIARLPASSGDAAADIEMYYATNVQGETYDHLIVPAPGVAVGTIMEHVVHSATLSSRLLIPATSGYPDVVTADRMGMFDKSIGLTTSTAKAVTWTLAGPHKQTWFEISQLNMTPGVKISFSVSNNGKKLHITNRGQDTSAVLRFQPDADTPVVEMGPVTLPGGTSDLDLVGPSASITIIGTTGMNGWYISPVKITLDAQDTMGKGIQKIEYSFDQLNWTAYAGPFLLKQEGITTVYARATDNNYLFGPVRQQEIKIDLQPPVGFRSA